MPKHQAATRKGQRKTAKGCELLYPGKKPLLEIIDGIAPAKLKTKERVGDDNANQLIHGDNLAVLRAMVDDPKIRGHVSLIYIDPPFGTGQKFVGYDDESIYEDNVVNFAFLEFMRQRLVLLRELLADHGGIYVHIDRNIGHYLKIILDEVFGEENFRNEITRIKCNPKNFDRKAFGNITDVIFFYSKRRGTKDDRLLWNDARTPLSEIELVKQFPKIDDHGRRYTTAPLHAKGETKNGPTGEPWKGLRPPKGRHWSYSPAELTRLDKAGLIEWSPSGNPRKIIYADESRGNKIQDVWDFKDPGYVKAMYPTEKNEDMLRQIIRASSREGDMVLDCFAGSGTTLAAADVLDRQWIGIDANAGAIKVARKRLMSQTKLLKRGGFTISEAT